LVIHKESLNENEEEKEGMYSIGKALPYVELKVTDPTNGKILPFGNTGELCVRSFSTLNCYWNDVENTKESLDSEGWYF
jgi:fatty-acyl-CoA synthase